MGISIALTALFVVGEAVAGYLSNSLAPAVGCGPQLCRRPGPGLFVVRLACSQVAR